MAEPGKMSILYIITGFGAILSEKSCHRTHTLPSNKQWLLLLGSLFYILLLDDVSRYGEVVS